MQITLIQKNLLRLVAAVLLCSVALGALAPAGFVQAASGSCAQSYTIRSGDTLRSIASAFNVTARELAQVNKIRPTQTLQAGEKLCIPGKRGSTTSLGSGSQNSRVSVSLLNGRIYITASGFLKDVTLMVKAHKITESSTWTDGVSKIKVKKGISQTLIVTLPSNLSGVNPVEICLKSMSSNEMNCYTVQNK